MIGIYKIQNIVNNKIYIGQSIDIITRWYNHKNELNGNRHCNSHLQGAWNKYGESNFTFEVIEECTVEEIDNREIYWIDLYKSIDPNFGYNLTAGGQGIHGYAWSNEKKLFLSKLRNPRPVLQLNLSGELVERWRSASYAARELNIPISGIMNCLKPGGDQYQCHGYIWIYENTYHDESFDIETYIEKHITPRPKIVEYDLYGNVVKIWNNAADIMYEFGEKSVIYKSLTCVLNHTRRSIKGKIFLYENDNFKLTEDYLRSIRIKTATYKVNQFDKFKNLVKTWSQEELKNSDYKFSSIRHFCTQAYVGNFINKPLYNYIWEYE